MTDRDRIIAERAHALWEEEGRPHGRHEEHWQKASRELDAGQGAPSEKPAKPARATAKGAAAKAKAPEPEAPKPARRPAKAGSSPAKPAKPTKSAKPRKAD